MDLNEDKRQEIELRMFKARERELSDMRDALTRPQGRRMVWSILSKCGIYGLSYCGNNSETFFKEGKRSIGLELLKLVEDAKPGSMDQMRREYVSELKSEENKRERIGESNA